MYTAHVQSKRKENKNWIVAGQFFKFKPPRQSCVCLCLAYEFKTKDIKLLNVHWHHIHGTWYNSWFEARSTEYLLDFGCKLGWANCGLVWHIPRSKVLPRRKQSCSKCFDVVVDLGLFQNSPKSRSIFGKVIKENI